MYNFSKIVIVFSVALSACNANNGVADTKPVIEDCPQELLLFRRRRKHP